MSTLFKMPFLILQPLYHAAAASTCQQKAAPWIPFPVAWNLQQLAVSARLCSASFFSPPPAAAYKADTCPVLKSVPGNKLSAIFNGRSFEERTHGILICSI